MSEHLYAHRKTSYQSASISQHSIFQPRPFVMQPQTEEQSEQPDLKTALERAKRYGHSLDRIKFGAPPVQRPEPEIVQAKLTIDEPGDGYEQEAEQMAQAKGEGKQPIPADPVIDMIRRSMLQRQAAISPQQKAEFQAEYEQAKRFGHNLSKLAPSHPDTAQPSPLQAKQNSGKSEAVHQSTVHNQLSPSPLRLQPLGRGGSKPKMQLPVQPKLTIGQPGDKYEQEADRVAAQVVNSIHAPSSQPSEPSQAVQRQEEPVEEIQAKPEITALQRQEEPVEEIQAKPSISDLGRSPLPTQVQREAMPEEEELQTKSILQRQEAIGGEEASTDVESAIDNARGGGQPLEAGLQRSMGQVMGADFSGVKVHTDAQADRLNRSVQARAFTTGQDVFFRSGEYNPGSRGGQELIAHELTHVVQQKGGVVQRNQEEANSKAYQPETTKGSATNYFHCELETIQRVEGTGIMGFRGFTKPRGWGSVSLTATLNGISLGDAWSRKIAGGEATDHAEDAVVDTIDCLEMLVEEDSFGLYGFEDEDLQVVNDLVQSIRGGNRDLVINSLTASPCCSDEGTSTKPDIEGCTQRLIELANRGYQITVNADHYYQPQNVDNARARSEAACCRMRQHGITVNIANP